MSTTSPVTPPERQPSSSGVDDADALAEAAATVRRLLAFVTAGELEAVTPPARALVRRLEGTVVALETPRNATRPVTE